MRGGRILLVIWIGLVGESALYADDWAANVQVEINQSVRFHQVDGAGLKHLESSFSLEARIGVVVDPDLSPIDPTPEVALPVAAMQSMPVSDFVSSPSSARFDFVSTEEEGDLSFPAGTYDMKFQTVDGASDCRFPFNRATFIGEGSHRPRVINSNGWKNGILCLPEKTAILRWESMGVGRQTSGDTSQSSKIMIRDNQTDEVVFAAYSWDPRISPFHPRFAVGNQEAIDLSGIIGIETGKAYEVILRKAAYLTFNAGDFEGEDRVASEVSFQVMIDPALPAASPPVMRLAYDASQNRVILRWLPDPRIDYLLFAGVDRLDDDGWRWTANERIPFITPPSPGSDHVYSAPISGSRGFFRLLSMPK